MAKKKINVVVAEEILEYMNDHAERLGLSRSAYISMLVHDEMKKEERRKNMMPVGYGYCEEY